MYRKLFLNLYVLSLIAVIYSPAMLFAQEIYLQELSKSLIGGNYSSFTSQDQYGFAAINFGFKIFDITDPENIVELSHIPTDGMASYVSVVDTLLFVCVSEGGLNVYDIGDINQPVLIDNLNPPGFIRSVCPYENYLYAAAEDFGLQIIDFSDPLNLELVTIIYPGGEPRKAVTLDN